MVGNGYWYFSWQPRKPDSTTNAFGRNQTCCVSSCLSGWRLLDWPHKQCTSVRSKIDKSFDTAITTRGLLFSTRSVTINICTSIINTISNVKSIVKVCWRQVSKCSLPKLGQSLFERTHFVKERGPFFRCIFPG